MSARTTTLVMKFGGLALGTTTALTQVLSIILHQREQWQRLLIVVSALEGVTDSLLEAIRLAQVSNRRGYRRIAATLRTRHLALMEHLPLGTGERQAIQADIDRLLFDMLNQLQAVADAATEDLNPSTADSIIGTGERLAARIVAALLRQNSIRAVAIDSQSIIITDDNFGNALPIVDASCERISENLLPMLERNIIPVITGFVGSTQDGRITTLGRGGSDYSASVIASCANANEMWTWTNVDGMMTTDPNDIEHAQVIPYMSYEEVGEMAYFGARVLHPRMIAPLHDGGIPLRIKNVYKPNLPGTLIAEETGDAHPALKAVTTIQGIGLTAARSGPVAQIVERVNEVLTYTAGSPAEVMVASQSSSRSFLCFVIPTSSGPDAARSSVAALRERLAQNPLATDWQVQQVGVLTVIGTDITRNPSIGASVMQQLQAVPLLAVAQGPSGYSLSVVMEPNYLGDALEAVHDLIVDQSGETAS